VDALIEQKERPIVKDAAVWKGRLRSKFPRRAVVVTRCGVEELNHPAPAEGWVTHPESKSALAAHVGRRGKGSRCAKLRAVADAGVL